MLPLDTVARLGAVQILKDSILMQARWRCDRTGCPAGGARNHRNAAVADGSRDRGEYPKFNQAAHTALWKELDAKDPTRGRQGW